VTSARYAIPLSDMLLGHRRRLEKRFQLTYSIDALGARIDDALVGLPSCERETKLWSRGRRSPAPPPLTQAQTTMPNTIQLAPFCDYR
jgi:hypothetical protein